MSVYTYIEYVQGILTMPLNPLFGKGCEWGFGNVQRGKVRLVEVQVIFEWLCEELSVAFTISLNVILGGVAAISLIE